MNEKVQPSSVSRSGNNLFRNPKHKAPGPQLTHPFEPLPIVEYCVRAEGGPLT